MKPLKFQQEIKKIRIKIITPEEIWEQDKQLLQKRYSEKIERFENIC